MTLIYEFNEWFNNHEENYTINHTGTTRKMEIDDVKEMFSRSMEKNGVKYTTYIGDGNSQPSTGSYC